MPDTTVSPVQELKDREVEVTKKQFADPYEFLKVIPNAPDKSTIDQWKVQTPNGRLRVFTPDAGRRVFIVRAIGGMELQRLQSQLPANLDAAKAEQEMHYLVGAQCTVWTNSDSGKLSPEDLRNTSAGLPVTLFQLVSWISDFVDPDSLSLLSAEL